MKGRLAIAALIMAIVLSNMRAFAEPSAKRLKALDTLWRAYTQVQQGSVPDGLKGIDEALSIDPDLAYANIVKGEIAMQSQDWETSRKYFERGLLLLKQPNQPISPDKSARITSRDIEADSRCFLGYVYIKLARQANRQGKANIEQEYLEKADKSLRTGIALGPGNEARELALKLLKMFK
jgi:hypothetical protein